MAGSIRSLPEMTTALERAWNSGLSRPCREGSLVSPRKAGELLEIKLRAVSAAGRLGKVTRKEVVRDKIEVRGASVG